MKSALLFLLAAAVSFAAGWYLRPSESQETGGEGRVIVQQGDQGAPPPAAHSVNNALTGDPPVPIRPLESLEELLDVVQEIEMLGPVGAASAVQILPRLMITDLPTIRRLVDELAAHEHNRRREVYTAAHVALMFRWLTLQPAEAVGFSLANPHLLGDADELNQFGLLYLARTRPDAVKTLLPLLPENDRQEISGFLTLMESVSNPAAILTDEEKRRSLGGRNAEILTKAWFRKDPDAALQWVMALPDSERAEYSPQMFEQWYGRDPNAAVAWYRSLPDGPEKATTTAFMARAFGSSSATREELESNLAPLPSEIADPVRLDWLSRNSWKSDAKLKPDELANELSAIVGRNPSVAGAATEAASSVASAYVREERISDGVDWAMSLPHEGPRSSAVARMVSEWAVRDPAAASEWLADLPAGETRDAGVVALVNRISSDDPEAASIWARSIGNDSVRRENTKLAFRRWMEQDPFAAVQALSEVPAEDRAQMFPKSQE